MICENLLKFRTEKGYSRPQLAKESKVSIRTIEFIEWGRILSPGILTLEKLANALDVTVNDLIK